MNTGVRMTKFMFWLVSHLPRKLVYFCFLHVVAHSTTGKYGMTEAPGITTMEAIKRYERDLFSE